MLIIKQIPNFLTLLNLACGVISVVLGMEGYSEYSGIAILAAVVFDFLDGFMARLLKATSETGKELDSLADLISFGLAPSIIAYNLLKPTVFIEHLNLETIPTMDLLVLASPFLITIFSAIRLARFNVMDSKLEHFRGLPTPANALLFASLPLMIEYYEGGWFGMSYLLMNMQNVLLVLILVQCFLLVSPLPMLSLKFKSFSIRKNYSRYIFLCHIIGFIIFLKIRAIPTIILFYVLFSFTVFLIRLIFPRTAKTD
jgi:CDP-diacylglycerol--serine O-phosphatidyltransferase